jgi:hypothetical protein
MLGIESRQAGISPKTAVMLLISDINTKKLRITSESLTLASIRPLFARPNRGT